MQLKKVPRWPMQADPGIETQFMCLLEDFGVISVSKKHITFDDAMFQTSFYVPDAVIHLIVLFSAVYSVHLAGWI